MDHEPSPTATPRSASTPNPSKARTPDQWQAAFDQLHQRQPPRSPARQAQPSQARAMERWQRIVDTMGAKYAQATLENYQVYDKRQPPALGVLGAYIAKLPAHVRAGDALVLHGAVGTGKDHLLAAALRHAVFMRHYDARFTYGASLVKSLRRAIRDGRGEESVFAPLVACDVLAISDPLPAQGGLSDYQAWALAEIVRERYAHDRPIWLTLNEKSFDPASAEGRETALRLTYPVFDRLLDGGVLIACQWPSFRQRRRRNLED